MSDLHHVVDAQAPTESTDPHVLAASDALSLLAGAPWRRMAVVGDSIAEGTREPHPGYRDLSWVDRVAEALAPAHPDFALLNLGRRNLLAGEIRAGQLADALAFAPDLAFVIGGGNNMLRPEFDPAAVRADLAAMVAAFRQAGADVVMLGLTDITRAGLIPSPFAGGIRDGTARLNAVTESVAREHGAVMVSFAAHPAGADPGIYSTDLLHFNARGHAIAASGTIEALARHLASA